MQTERSRDSHPEDPEWRADALARSRHSRLLDELCAPSESFDREAAARLCGEICRQALGDFAPALILLTRPERLRAQVLTVFSLTLFDFANQRGLEGDRLAEINRWEFRSEEALSGAPAGQPVFVLLAEEHLRRPWPTDAIDDLFSQARRRATGRRSRDRKLEDVALARTLAFALLGTPAVKGVGEFGAAVFGLSRHLWGASSATRAEHGPEPTDALDLPLPHVTPPWNRAARYLQLAGRRFSKAPESSDTVPRLGLWTRLLFLTRARLAPG